jgi:hypothetical protein
MDFPAEANGTHVGTGKPYLLMTDQDHPLFMTQLVWSLMYILEQKGIAGVPFDMDDVNSYNRLHTAISTMIADAVPAKASLAEMRAGTNDTKFGTALGVTAALGNYSKYVSVSTTPSAISADDVGALLIASGSASVFNLPAIAGVRTGAAYHFLNLTAGNITINRDGASTITSAAGTLATSFVVRRGQQATVVKIAAGVWAVIPGAIITREFVSAELSIATTTLHTLAHGFGVEPRFYETYLKCTKVGGANGFTQGQVFKVDVGPFSGNHRGCVIWSDTTNINIRLGAGGTQQWESFNPTNGDRVVLDAANYSLIVKAYA